MRHPRLTTVTRLVPAHAGRAPGQSAPPLLAVAHGSKDPRAAATITGLMGLVGGLAPRRGLPVPDIRTAYLGHAPPSVTQVLGALAGTRPAGPGLAATGLAARSRRIVVLPLLLTAAYHSEVDLPALLSRSRAAFPGLRISYGEPLGPDPLLLRVLDRRLAECGAPGPAAAADPGITEPETVPRGHRHPPARPLPSSPGDIAVVLAAAGSSRAAANAAIADVAADWQAARGWRAVVPAYAAAAVPTPAEAVTALLRDGAPCVVVSTYLLAPGVFADQVGASVLQAGAAAVSGALGAAPEVAEVILRRYAEVIAASGRMDAARPGDAYPRRGSCQ
jgi:sirohydrochlorin ferrochelatase